MVARSVVAYLESQFDMVRSFSTLILILLYGPGIDLGLGNIINDFVFAYICSSLNLSTLSHSTCCRDSTLVVLCEE